MDKIIKTIRSLQKICSQNFIYILQILNKNSLTLRVIQKMVPQTLNAGSASLCLGLSDISITHYNQQNSPVYKFGTKQIIQNVLPLKLRTNGKSFTLFPMLIKCLCYPSKREEIIGKRSVNIWEYWRGEINK